MKKLNKIFDDLSILIFVLMVVVVIVQVVCRYCFKLSVPWTEELSRLLFIYVGFTGTAIAVRENELIVVDVLLTRLPAGIRKVMDVLIQIVMFAFFLLMFIGAIKMFMSTKGTYFQSMPFLSNGWTYMAVIIGMAASLVGIITNAIKNIKEALKKNA